MMEFDRQKSQRLAAVDLSRKGSIDEEIIELVTFINEQQNIFTTSSCSGRIAIFSENPESSKKGCKWLHISHNTVEVDEVRSCIFDTNHDSTVVFKFEPFVLHVQCRTLEDAKLMHQAAVESGFRNSGITIGKNGKVIMAVRSTHGLEAPLSNNGTVLVSVEYVAYLVELANSKLMENSTRIQRFFSNLKQAIAKDTQSNAREAGKVQKRPKLKENFRKNKVKHRGTQCDQAWRTSVCPHDTHDVYCRTCCDESCVGSVTKDEQGLQSVNWTSCGDVCNGDTVKRRKETEKSKLDPTDELDDLEMGLQFLGVDLNTNEAALNNCIC